MQDDTPSVRRPVVVVGIGNTLLSDEGIGVRVVQALQAEAGFFPEAELLELATGGMAVLHAIAGRRKAIIVDCAFMELPPGALRRFGPEEIRSRTVLSGWSLHEGNFLELLQVSRQLGMAPSSVVIFGIQPASISPGERLSPPLEDGMSDYLIALRSELRSS